MRVLFEFLGMPVTYLTFAYCAFIYIAMKPFVKEKIEESYGLSSSRADDAQQWLIYLLILFGRVINVLPVAYYSTMYMLGALVVIQIAKRNAKRFEYKEEDVEFYVYTILFFGLIFARAYYVIFKWDDFRNNLLEIVAFWKGIRGLAIHGGIIGAAIGIFVIARYKKVKLLNLADAAALCALVAQSIGRLGNLINGEAHGVPTFTPIKVLLSGKFNVWFQEYLSNPFKTYYPELVPWGIVFGRDTAAGQEFPNMPTHPTMIYEIVLNVLGFCILNFYFKNKKVARGSLASIYLVIYAINRTIVSTFRADDLYFMGFKMPYVTSLVLAIIGLSSFYYLNYMKTKKDTN